MGSKEFYINTKYYSLTMLSITEPTLLLDKNKCLQNIERLVNKAKAHDVRFRPHFKTHQSHVVGRWFRQLGVQHITVSSLRMASYFAADGWTDITVAFPVNILEIERINQLANSITLNVIVEDLTVVDFLEQRLQASVNAFVKIDVGYKRTGIAAENSAAIDAVVQSIAQTKKINFLGFLAHAGHTYNARSHEAILATHQNIMEKMLALKAAYQTQFPNLQLSIGDTPAGSIATNFAGVDEIRPGNAVFYDVKMTLITACQPEQIAVAMAAPVVSLHPERNEVILYCGSVHLSKDFAEADGIKSFGQVVLLNDGGWSLPVEGAYISSLSQEHGHLKASTDFITSLKVGDVVGILPAHSCLAVACMRSYTTLNGEKIKTMEW
jgi:D-serine deaminase-like pyridoxal phosphate-dependent protein